MSNKPFPKTPPKHLTKVQAKAWREIVSVVPGGVLRGSDMYIVNQCAVLVAELWQDGSNMTTPRLAQLRITLGALGMTPADRSKVVVDKPPENPFDNV